VPSDAFNNEEGGGNMIKEYRSHGVPLLALECADPTEVTVAAVNEMSGNGNPAPIMVWDMVKGLEGVNDAGTQAAATINKGPDAAIATGNPVECLRALTGCPNRSVVVMYGMASLLQREPAIVQALWNLRSDIKPSGSIVVLTVPLGYKLPSELSNDVMTAVVPLPDEKRLGEIVNKMHDCAEIERPDEEGFARAVDAVVGLAAFPAEQTVAMSISKNGMDLVDLWERKRRMIEQTPGLSVWRGAEKFVDVGGCDNVKSFFLKLLAGKRRPRCILFIDEIEKGMAGSASDSSGVSQALLGYSLTWMQNTNATGAMFIGPPGAAKSMFSKAVGNEAGCPTIAFDYGAMKGSLVGESEARIRAAYQIVDAIGQGRVLCLATCNSIGVLPPELRRRYTLGTFYFDLPTDAERREIWNIWAGKYELDPGQTLPPCEGWTGAEIRQCCDIADRLGISLAEAAAFVVPVAVSAADKIEELRRQATGRFLSANYSGIYQYQKVATSGRSRQINVEAA
jgi:hypothetical protein